jgi:hypothetical protein
LFGNERLSWGVEKKKFDLEISGDCDKLHCLVLHEF